MRPAPRFHRFVVRGDAVTLDLAAALAWESGAVGCEEDSGAPSLTVYAPSAVVARVQSSLLGWSRGEGATLWVGPAEPVADRDWSHEHRAHQPAVEISDRLRIRPPWLPGRSDDVVLEARQAFGTGTHASTALALEALDAELVGAGDESRAGGGASVLDVGCGSGVLSIAALRCGARRVFACDLDPIAAHETTRNARSNGVGARVAVWCGGLEALGSVPVDGAVANMIRREITPVLPDLCGKLAAGGWLWLSGLLDSDRGEIEAALGRCGFRVDGERERPDGDERWIALRASRLTASRAHARVAS